MNIFIVVLVMFLSLFLLLATGRHIFIVLGAVGSIAGVFLWGGGGQNLAFYGAMGFLKWFPIVTIPLFIFMGFMLQRSGVASRLFDLMYMWVGHIRGGLAIGTIGICAVVAMMTGESAAGTVTAGTIGLPEMLKRKYDKLLVTGLVMAAGALGFLIPPSIVFILYGVIAGVSIGHLWLAGVFPGLILIAFYIIYIVIRSRIQPHFAPARPLEEAQPSWNEKVRAIPAGLAPIGLIIVVLGLLILGVTSIIECAAIAAAGALVITAAYRRLNWQVLKRTMDDTLLVTCMFMWIFAGALCFSAVFDGLGAVHAVRSVLMALGGSGIWVIVIMQLSLFLLGMVLEDTAMLLIVAPLYIPIVHGMGYDLVWFGVLYVINVQVAYLTPPFGYNLFIMKGIAPPEITMVDIYKSVWPFVAMQLICLGLVMRFPQIALWLPGIVFGK